jgi:hypothetical protein
MAGWRARHWQLAKVLFVDGCHLGQDWERPEDYQIDTTSCVEETTTRLESARLWGK